MKLQIEYSRNGLAIRDADVEETYQILLNDLRHNLKDYEAGDDYYYMFSTENIIMRIRVGLKRGELKPGEVSIFFDDKVIPFDESGRSNIWPKGFCDLLEMYLEELV